MKNKKFLLLVGLLFALGMFLTACGGGEKEEGTGSDGGNDTGSETENDTGAEDNDADAGDKPEFLSLLTGGTSGTYYPLGGEMASIITDETGIQTDAVSSNASADNIAALQAGEAELAFAQTDVTANAVEGINSFDGNPVDNIQAIASLYPETIQIVTVKDSGITSVADLAGKTVSVGAPGSGTYVNATQILEAYGLSMDDIDAQNLDFGESTGGIQDGNIDAAFITAGTPTGAVEGLAATTDVSIVPIEQDKIDSLIEQYPYYAADTVKAGTYDIEEDVNTVAVLAMLVVTDSLSEDVVYDITKAIFDNTDKITHAKGEYITKESALDGIGIDLHPGAKKYFEEEGLLD
ncbi:TAXI family TRAP transporter solute-binding subunit [Aquibacillus salsiterrae]|uniref:TAXI family TRAP transporter solute-binding subunit n=1 Tax=Aquibacillus salsiterrae TaxID=2950439 RepID=A0A9X4AEU2_9BACI|nr:TAXI family TRAP transporter solute-binding subunit [Aquibacillus salsiterrae]MDC3417307.1 TAXI family TRAP transporter solute-binding subunit [Aquibacillus salsiterrae]